MATARHPSLRDRKSKSGYRVRRPECCNERHPPRVLPAPGFRSLPGGAIDSTNRLRFMFGVCLMESGTSAVVINQSTPSAVEKG
jgi:hypothetical protein